MVPDLVDAAFELPEDGVSAPVRSPFGWHVLQVTGIEDEGIAQFEDVRDEIELAVKRDQALDLMFEFANGLDDAMAGGASLAEAVDELGLSLISTPPLSAEGEAQRQAETRPVPALADVLATAWTLSNGETSSLQETEARDGYYIVRVDRIVLPAIQPLAEVRDAVVAAWTADQFANAAIALAEQAESRLTAGESAVVIANDLGPATRAGETPGLLRDGSNRGDLPGTLVSRLFEMELGATTLLPTEAGALAARLTSIERAEPSANDRGTLADEIRRGLTEDMLAQYLSALRASHTVEVNLDTVNRLRGEEG